MEEGDTLIQCLLCEGLVACRGYAVTHHECNVYEFTASGGGTPSDDFFEESEPYVCEKKEYAPRKLTLREKILFGA